MVLNATGPEMERIYEIYKQPKATNNSGLTCIAVDTRFVDAMLGPFLELNGDYGRWDIKRNIQRDIAVGIILCGSDGCGWFDYSTPGNIHYGFIAAATGVPENLSMLAGGYLQVFKDRQFEWNWWSTAFEDPQDFAAVQFGYNLYETYGTEMTLDDFQTALTADIRDTFQPPIPAFQIPGPAQPQANWYPPRAFNYYDKQN